MTKTHKAVLSTLAVLCLLFMGSGVAQAQECFAFQSESGDGSRRGQNRVGGRHPIAVQGPRLKSLACSPLTMKAVISIKLNTADHQ